jgi:hypothetical protein
VAIDGGRREERRADEDGKGRQCHAKPQADGQRRQPSYERCTNTSYMWGRDGSRPHTDLIPESGRTRFLVCHSTSACTGPVLQNGGVGTGGVGNIAGAGVARDAERRSARTWPARVIPCARSTGGRSTLPSRFLSVPHLALLNSSPGAESGAEFSSTMAQLG